MRILFLDTSSSFLYCGLVSSGNVVFEIKKDLGRDLSQFTLFEIQKKFNENKISTDSVDKIILVNGPGSFTGVRIAITIAKIYGWALNIPVIVISSLQAMAASIDNDTNFFVPIIDARRGYCYSAIYDNDLNPILKEQYINLDTLKVALEKLGDNYIVISNDSFDFECVKYDPNILKIINTYKDTKEFENIHLINANYLKSTEAEEKLNDSVN